MNCFLVCILILNSFVWSEYACCENSHKLLYTSVRYIIVFWIPLGRHELSKLDNYHYLKLSCSALSSAEEQSKTEREKSQMNDEQDTEDEMFVCFGSLFSDEGDFPQEKKTNNQRSSRHQSHASESFSEMWLILRKSKPDVIDVFFHTRLI